MQNVKQHQRLPHNWEQREVLRESGQFWTPSWVAEPMVEYVSKDTDLIFDPATGRGAFFKPLLKNKKEVSFYGIDIDDEVLQDSIYNNDICFVENRDFIKNPPNRKFKAIVANPPYIRHHRIDEDTKLRLKILVNSIVGNRIDGRAGLHIYFLIQALNLLEPEGKLAFIMPADTCEGKFSSKLWKWISSKFCIECVVTFNEKATPFPNVDTNALIIFIKNTNPKSTFLWAQASESYSQDLLSLVLSNFECNHYKTLRVVSRNIDEGIATGLSRPQQNTSEFNFFLKDFAKVMRGIATGSNEFFFLNSSQVDDLSIPREFFKRAIGRTKDVPSDLLTFIDVDELDNRGRPTYLLSLNGKEWYPKTIMSYLGRGEEIGLPNRPLIQQRKPWFKMERREVPPILFAYLGRRNTRFILNEAGVLPLTAFLCVYPVYKNQFYIKNLWKALNHPDTLVNLKLVGKSYGSGAIKVEPSSLNQLPIPNHIVEEYELNKPYQNSTGQLEIFS